MKKVLASITVFFYFIVSCGVVINLHYCMGDFQSFQLYSVKSDECGKCGMHMDDENDCCKDEVKIIKLEDKQNRVNINYSIQGLESDNQSTSDFITASLLNRKDFFYYNTHSPPLISQQDTYLQNCVFRI